MLLFFTNYFKKKPSIRIKVSNFAMNNDIQIPIKNI